MTDKTINNEDMASILADLQEDTQFDKAAAQLNEINLVDEYFVQQSDDTSEEEEKTHQIMPLSIGKVVAKKQKWAFENTMRKCIITSTKTESKKTDCDEFFNIAGKGSSTIFYFNNTKRYHGNDPAANIKLQLECFSRDKPCFVQLNVNGTILG